MSRVEIKTFDTDRRLALGLARQIGDLLTREGHSPAIDALALMATLGAVSATGIPGSPAEVMHVLFSNRHNRDIFDECRSACFNDSLGEV